MTRRGPEHPARDEPGLGHLEIPTRELAVEHLPATGADWGAVARFALSFDGYRRWGSFERCAEIGDRWADAYMTGGELPDTLDLCRTCLFFEQRRWRDRPSGPDAPTRRYVGALLDRIGDLVRRGPGAKGRPGPARRPRGR
jgi:hypothetical protein